MNTAEYIVKKLEELGINEYFGVPGDFNFNIINAIENNSQSRWVGCTNELNAGYAADGYARIKGYGALVTNYGAGELCAVNSIAGSFSENVPVVHLVGIPSTTAITNNILLHGTFQEVNYSAYQNIYKNVTAASTLLTRENAKIEIDRIFKTMIKEKKPVYIAIPSDVAILEISDRYVSYDYMSDKATLNEAAEKISEKINHSQNPVIIGDILVKRFNAELEYKEFIEKSQIPYTNLLMGINLSPMENKMFLGGYYSDLKNTIAKKYIDESDCIISIGTINSDLNAFGFDLPKLINHIAIYGNYTYIDGKKYENIKMADLLNAVTELIEQKDIKIDKTIIGYKHREPLKEDITSEFIYTSLQEFFKENDIIIADTGSVQHGIAPMHLPNNVNVEMQALWNSSGWATSAALGVGLAKPNTRMVIITGEGAHLMSATEIGNILKQGLKPIFIVINNNGYSTERLMYGNADAGLNNIVQLNYSKFARAFEGEVWATKVTTCEDLDKALKVTQIMNKMCYIEVITDKTDVPTLTRDLVKKLLNEQPAQSSCNVYSAADINNPTRVIEDNDSLDTGLPYETVVHKAITEV